MAKYEKPQDVDTNDFAFALSLINADAVIDTISKVSNTGKIGDGKISVSSLEQVVRIRTGELNEDAL